MGGGSVPNGTPHSLSHISLRWMVRECLKTNTGILFSNEALHQIGLDPTRCSFAAPVSIDNQQMPVIQSLSAEESTHGSTQVSEGADELQDALSNIHDELERSWFWWILELLPFRRQYYNNGWKSIISYVSEFLDALQITGIYYFFHS